MLAIGGFDELTTGFAVQTESTHQSSNPTDTVATSLRRQFGLNTRRTITAFVLVVDVLDQQFEVSILDFSC